MGKLYTADVVVIGAGPAGMAAALKASEKGAKVILLERDTEPGGILNQCIHAGFGLYYFKEQLTGPEYAQKFMQQLQNSNVELLLNTMALSITTERVITAINTSGLIEIQAGAVILATGCRERTRGAIGIMGTRPAGIFTAGTAQRYMNIDGYMVGKKVVILGSGDVGLIMARRLTLEGATVLACIEIMPFSSGLTRNIVQCLDDFDIPLLLSHTVTNIKGQARISSVTVMQVDENRRPIQGTDREIACDTLLLSVGLIPENELFRGAGVAMDSRTGGAIVNQYMQTSVAGVFACGNALQVHDLVDYVTMEAQTAGESAQLFIEEADTEMQHLKTVNTIAGDNVSYVLPQKIACSEKEKVVTISLRVKAVTEDATITVYSGTSKIAERKESICTPGEMLRFPIAMKNIAEDITITVTNVGAR